MPEAQGVGVKVVWIILRTDPIRIRILRIWRRTFNIRADTDNPNPIVCGYGVGYGIGKIRRIWIIRKFYADYPMFKIGYPKVFSSKTKKFRILKSLLAEDFYFLMLLFNVLIFKLRNSLDAIIYWLVTYYFLVNVKC